MYRFKAVPAGLAAHDPTDRIFRTLLSVRQQLCISLQNSHK